MKILHTADLHLGQVLYQSYDRADEHRHFFKQLERWCREEAPDALLVCGDVFDIPHPSAATHQLFTDSFVALHRTCPSMKIVITAGNHDSASRIQADSSLWQLANAVVVGTAPAVNADDGWQDRYIVRLESGYVVAMPYMNGERTAQLQSVLDRVALENTDGKPVVMMAHAAVAGMDAAGHGCEIGTIRTQELSSLGEGFDYCALGHIHKPQTLGYPQDCMAMDERRYPSGVARYSGSALHVSCDEKYPHTVTAVTIEHHGGEVAIRQLRIDELRHFHELPADGEACFATAVEALAAVADFAAVHRSGYIRLRVDYKADLPPNFCNMVYDALRPYGDEVRFNPKHIWMGKPENTLEEVSRPVFQVAELQEMKDPYEFVVKTIDQYEGLDAAVVKEAFEEVKAEMRRLAEEASKPSRASKATENSTTAATEAL